MVRARWLRQWTACAAVFVLLLKAAVPMFASAAAALQGTSVAQICEVYGVRTVLPQATHGHHGAHGHHADHQGHDDPSPDHGSHSAATHAAGHCALTALAALAPYDAAPVTVPRTSLGDERAPLAGLDSIPDPSAAWAARLRHGPPATTSRFRFA